MADKRNYKLKKGPAFEPVEGPFAGTKFETGKIYPEFPEAYADRFVEVKEPVKKPAVKTKTPKAGGDK